VRVSPMKDSQVTSSSVNNRTINIADAWNYRIRNSESFVEPLIESQQSLIFLVEQNTGMLLPGLISEQSRVAINENLTPVSQYKRVIKRRPFLYADIDQINEEQLRSYIPEISPLDYMGNDREELRRLTNLPEFSNRRPRYIINNIDNAIACALGSKIMQANPAKRPRIDINQFYELYDLLPNRLLHLINIMNCGKSLILHLRSQRTENFNSIPSSLSRLEKIFYYCALPNDGPYLSFEKSREKELIKYILCEDKCKNKYVKDEALFVSHLKEMDRRNGTKDYLSILLDLKIKIIPSTLEFKSISLKSTEINLSNQSRYKSYKDRSGTVRVPNPGSRQQKIFYDARYKKLLETPPELMKTTFERSMISKDILPYSIGRISKHGRDQLKRNLRQLYGYYNSVDNARKYDPDLYWKNEALFIEIEIFANLLLWHTNLINPLLY